MSVLERGNAQRLVTRGMLEMGMLGVPEVRLEVRPRNQPALALYTIWEVNGSSWLPILQNLITRSLSNRVVKKHRSSKAVQKPIDTPFELNFS